MANPRWERVRATASRVAEGVRDANRHPGAVDAVRRMRRVLPGDSGFGDPLSAAGRDSAGTVARVAGRLFDDHPTASREFTLGGLQLWHSLTERTGRGGGEDVTIVFTDLVNFSDWAMRAGDEASLRLLRAVASATEPHVHAHRGHVVKRLGDGLMAVFPSPQLAFDAVVACNAGVREIDMGAVEPSSGALPGGVPWGAVPVEVSGGGSAAGSGPGWRPRIRAGIHTGRPRAIGGDYLGVDVNIAARLAERAGPGEILVSGTSLSDLDDDRVSTRRKRGFRPGGVKGVPEEVAVYVAAPR